MSEGVEQEVVPRPGSGDDEGETNTENAGSTPLPPSAREEEQEEMKPEEEAPPTEEPQDQPPPEEATDEAPPPEDGPAPDSQPAQVPVQPPSTTAEKGYTYSFRPGAENLPLTINHVAISASAQNKLPVNRVKGIVLRIGRHTESSAQKQGTWYRSPTYVDKDSYTWRNMPLFDDYQTHLWTREGTVRSSFKK